MATLQRTIANGDDDAWESALGTFTSTSDHMRAGAAGSGASRYNAGMRFTNITVPSGAEILVATIDVDILSIDDDDPHNDIHCEAVADAVDFVDDAEVRDRALTTASVFWDDEALLDGIVTSPNFAVAVQEVVNIPGWTSGNALVVMFRGRNTANQTFRFDSFEAAGNPAQLNLEYRINDDIPQPASHGAVIQRGPGQVVLS